MKYRVNNACIGCGFCASTCPEIFEMNDDRRAVAADREVPPELESAAEEALHRLPRRRHRNGEMRARRC